MFSEELKEMFISFTFNDNETYKVYHKKLTNSGLDVEIIKKRLNYLSNIWKPEFGKKIPSVSEILGVNFKDQETGECEEAWQKFKSTCCNNHRFEPMEDWVFTIKKAIGAGEVEDMTPDSEKWVKKEFIRIFPSVKAGLMTIQSEPFSYKIEKGNTIRITNAENILEIGE